MQKMRDHSKNLVAYCYLHRLMQIIPMLGLGEQIVRHPGLKYLCNEQHYLQCPSFFGTRIRLGMGEYRNHLNIFSLAFLSKRAAILPGLLEIPSNT